MEVLLTFSVIASLLTIGIPAFRTLAIHNKLQSISNLWLHFVYLAKSEAILRNSNFVICKSADESSCANQGDWSQGWILFSDADANGNRDADEQLLMKQSAIGPDYRMSGNTNLDTYVSYTPLVGAKLKNGGFQAGSITLCNALDPDGNAVQLILSPAGRWRTANLQGWRCK